MKKRVISIMMAVILLVAMMPMSAFAADMTVQNNVMGVIDGAVASGLFISDYKCEMNGKTANISFTLWNELGKSASVIVFDKDGNEVFDQHKICKKYTKGINSVKQWAEGGWQWITRFPSLFDSRQHFKLLAQDTPVTVQVPENGYILITSDPLYDPYAYILDGLDLIGMSLSATKHVSEVVSAGISWATDTSDPWDFDTNSLGTIFNKDLAEKYQKNVDKVAIEALRKAIVDKNTKMGPTQLKTILDLVIKSGGGYDILQGMAKNVLNPKAIVFSVSEELMTKATGSVGAGINALFAQGDSQNIAAWIEGMRVAIGSGCYRIDNNPDALTNSSANNSDYSTISIDATANPGWTQFKIEDSVKINDVFSFYVVVEGKDWPTLKLVAKHGELEQTIELRGKDYSSGYANGMVHYGYVTTITQQVPQTKGDWTFYVYSLNNGKWEILPGVTKTIRVIDPDAKEINSSAKVMSVELTNTGDLNNTTPLYFKATGNDDTESVKFIGDDGYDWGIVTQYTTVNGQRVFTSTRADITYANGTRSMNAFPVINDTILWDNGAECKPFAIPSSNSVKSDAGNNETSNSNNAKPTQETEKPATNSPSSTPAPQPTPTDTVNKVYFGGHQYAVIDQSMTWKEAKVYCESLGGHLATITSQQEQDFVFSLTKQYSKNMYWLGGTDEKTEGSWAWVTGETWNYTNWSPTEPNGGTRENCLTIFRIAEPGQSNSVAGNWNDIPDSGANDFYALSNTGFVCEWDNYGGAPTPTQTSQPLPSPTKTPASTQNSSTGKTYGQNGKFLAPITVPEDGSIPISNREELEAIVYNLNGKYHLTTDIDLGGAKWTPIGNRDRTNPSAFTGVFDGQGYVLRNLNITDATKDNGLFGAAENAVIKNVGLEDSNISLSSKYTNSIGGIVGTAGTNVSIINCYNAGIVSSFGSDSAYVGGIVGWVTGGMGQSTFNIDYCYNTGSISASSLLFHADVSGLIGKVHSHDGSYVINIRNCFNSGNVSASSPFYACSGGIVGRNDGHGKISNCYNIGDISAYSSDKLPSDAPRDLAPYANAGGIVGSGSTINNCYNTGNVLVQAPKSSGVAGGIIGSGYDLSDCYNIGNVSASALIPNVGGIAGTSHDNNRIKNCYWNTDGSQEINGTRLANANQKGIGTGLDTTRSLSSDHMKSYSNFVGFDFNNIWVILPNVNNGYPSLTAIPQGIVDK